MPPEEAESALAAHADLYARRGARIALDVADGAISLDCQHATGYGYASAIAWDARTPLDALAAELPD